MALALFFKMKKPNKNEKQVEKNPIMQQYSIKQNGSLYLMSSSERRIFSPSYVCIWYLFIECIIHLETAMWFFPPFSPEPWRTPAVVKKSSLEIRTCESVRAWERECLIKCNNSKWVIQNTAQVCGNCITGTKLEETISKRAAASSKSLLSGRTQDLKSFSFKNRDTFREVKI